ncbi:MAG TPA: tRNA pseudouridine(54/55) synthase Pus10, partial [Thermoplasmata archaeon]|nr:tRNA pseudouridine(54/55) synthase Pus10 [Thermoplasmata archaeon]
MDEVLAAGGAVDWAKLGDRVLCDACLGRLFGKVGHGHTNEERGRAVRDVAGHADGPCWVCAGLTARYDALASLVVRKLEPWEYDTFRVGSRIDPEVSAREESLWSDLALAAPEPLKAEVNREVGKRVCESVGREPDLAAPDIVAVLDPAFDHVDLQVNPLYLRGRYRKLARGVPQTRWPCRRCMGKGCTRCGGTGKMYPTSVEEVIAAEVMRESGGTGHALHGMGREDVDARMLGRGRPFIVEIKEPRRRHLEIASAVAGINASGIVEVDGLAPARGADVVGLKEDRAAKTYRVLFRTVPPVEEAKLKGALPVLVPEPIAQQTPERVVHRRADTTRHRSILAAEVVRVDGDRAEIRVTAEAGTYIKEWVHGDRGRTSPSLAERLGVACEVIELDV